MHLKRFCPGPCQHKTAQLELPWTKEYILWFSHKKTIESNGQLKPLQPCILLPLLLYNGCYNMYCAIFHHTIEIYFHFEIESWGLLNTWTPILVIRPLKLKPCHFVRSAWTTFRPQLLKEINNGWLYYVASKFHYIVASTCYIVAKLVLMHVFQPITSAGAAQLSGVHFIHGFIPWKIKRSTHRIAFMRCKKLVHAFLSKICVAKLIFEVWAIAHKFCAVNCRIS